MQGFPLYIGLGFVKETWRLPVLWLDFGFLGVAVGVSYARVVSGVIVSFFI